VGIGSGRRRNGATRWAVAPWIVLSAVAVVLLAGVTAGYAWLARGGCSGGRTTLTVLASPDHATVLASLAEQWSRDQPVVDGTCAAVDVQTKDSAATAAALSPSWDPRRDGPRPDVWAPESTMWSLVAASRPDAATLLPAKQTSLAGSIVVIAMPKPMAQALGWPGDIRQSWVGLLVGLRAGWAAKGHPEWGKFTIGMSDPTRSTAGLHALLAVADSDGDGAITRSELVSAVAFERALTRYEPDTTALLAGLAAADEQSEQAALKYVSAFPATERDVARYNASNPRVPLVALYPGEGSFDADHPYLALNAPWVDQTRKDIAAQFATFVTGASGWAAYRDEGFRGADRSAPPSATEQNGLQAAPRVLQRTLTDPKKLSAAITAWRGVRKRANILMVFDNSGSVAEPNPSTPSISRLDLAKQAARVGIAQFSPESKLGIWAFSTKMTATTDWKQLVPIRPVGTDTGPRGQRQACLDAVLSMKAKGGTALYDTALASFRAMKAEADPDRLNLVVLVTDGADEDPSGITKPDLLRTLKAEQNPDKPVRIITIGESTTADLASIKQISDATGGASYAYKTLDNVLDIFIQALFGVKASAN
jgi:Ca-activated chloride channel family protein